MSIPNSIYLVQVKVHQPGQRYKLRTYHIEAKKPSEARSKVKGKGIVLSAHKADLSGTFKVKDGMLGGLQAEPTPAVAMDEMIWLKRNKRRANLYKDKVNLTLDK